MLKITTSNPMAQQYQLEYAMYMMLGSYFKRATCKSKRIEEKLFLHYQDLTSRKQENLEDDVLRLIDSHLLKALNITNIDEREAIVRFIPQENGNLLNFKGSSFDVSFMIQRKDRKLKYTFVRHPEDKDSNSNCSDNEKAADKKKPHRRIRIYRAKTAA